MLFSKRKVAEIVEPTGNNFGAAIPQVEDAGVMNEYIKISRELGYVCSAVRIYELDKFLAENNMVVYNYQQVAEHIEILTRESDLCWGWYQLREQDKLNIKSEFWVPGAFIQKVYDKPVPLSVLGTVKKIQDAFSDAKFFVSELHVVKDPFLLVTFDGTENNYRIVDFWNEPGFRPIA